MNRPTMNGPGRLAVIALVCALLALTTHGTIRLIAGLPLCLYLPGRIAVHAFHPPRHGLDPWLTRTLSGALSLAATMLVGLVIASAGRGVPAAAATIALAAACLLLAAAAHQRDRHPPTPAAPTPAGPSVPVTGDGGRRHAAWLPAAVLTVALIVPLAAAATRRTADSSFTELAVQPATATPATVVVHSRERHTTTYRYEERSTGHTLRSTRFTLRPDQLRRFTLPTAIAPIEVRLYRGDDHLPYRRITTQRDPRPLRR